MSKTIQEQIEVMAHYLNGGEVEIFSNDNWVDDISPGWNWNHCDYRIKKQKKTITIEKWLYENLDKNFIVIECDNEQHNTYSDYKKIKLLESKEIEL